MSNHKMDRNSLKSGLANTELLRPLSVTSSFLESTFIMKVLLFFYLERILLMLQYCQSRPPPPAASRYCINTAL